VLVTVGVSMLSVWEVATGLLLIDFPLQTPTFLLIEPVFTPGGSIRVARVVPGAESGEVGLFKINGMVLLGVRRVGVVLERLVVGSHAWFGAKLASRLLLQ
jgi:hypothetical protein